MHYVQQVNRLDMRSRQLARVSAKKHAQQQMIEGMDLQTIEARSNHSSGRGSEVVGAGTGKGGGQ